MPSVQDAPENYFGITDAAELEEVTGEYTSYRLCQLENENPLTSFTREDLVGVHAYLMQDVYPWNRQGRPVDANPHDAGRVRSSRWSRFPGPD